MPLVSSGIPRLDFDFVAIRGNRWLSGDASQPQRAEGTEDDGVQQIPRGGHTMRWTVIGIALMCLCGCASNDEPERSSDEVRRQVEARGANFIRFYEEGKVDSVVALFADDAWLIPPGIPAVVGREAIREHVSQGMAVGGWTQTVTTEAVATCGRLAIERGRYSLRFRPDERTPEGMAAFSQSGDYLIYWTLIGGDWYIETYMGSTDGPPEPLS